MGKSKLNAILCGLIALCVLCGLYLDAVSPGTVSFGGERTRAAAAMRCLPVYSNLIPADGYEIYDIDTTHGGEGFFAVTAKSTEAVKVRAAADDGTARIYNVPESGAVAYYPLCQGSGTYTIELLRRVGDEPDSEKYELVRRDVCEAALFDEFQPYLRPSTYVWFTGYSDCVSAAAKLCAGVSNDDRKIELITDYVAGALDYDKTLAKDGDQSYIRDPDLILARGTGTCLDYAVLTAAMLRSQGIPTKIVYGDVRQGESVFHAWNMVYTSSRGWFRVDVTFADHGIAESFIRDDGNYTDLGWY